MKQLKEDPRIFHAIIGMFAFGAMLCIAHSGYQIGVWLKIFF